MKKTYATRNDIWTILFVGALGLTVRLSHVFLLSVNDPAFEHPFLDARWHVEWARALAMGIWEPEAFFRAPLYPFFLAFLFKLFGFAWLAPRLAQCLIGAVNCVLIYFLGKEFGGRKIGTVSGIVAAVYGTFIYFDGELLIPVIFIPLTLAYLLLTIRAGKRCATGGQHLPAWAIAGFAAGVAAIARPNVLILVPGIFLWILWEMKDYRRALAAFAVWTAMLMVPVGGVTIYNAAQGGGFVPVASQGGINFWIGNNHDSDGKTATSPTIPDDLAESDGLYRDSVRVGAKLVAENALGKKLKPAEISSYWFGRAFRSIINEPGAWLKLTFKKIYFLINGYELPSNRDIYRVRKWSPVLRFLLWEKPLAFPFGLLFPLAMAGIVFSLGNPGVNRPVGRLLSIYTLLYGAGAVAFFITARHRLPLVPALIPFAALIIAAIPRGVKNSAAGAISRPGVSLASMVVFGIALTLSNMNYFDARKVPLTEHYMAMGYVMASEGRYEEAIEEFEAAIAESPRTVRARFNVGSAYMKMGEYNSARKAYIEIIKMDPSNVNALSHIASTYFQENNFTEAERIYRKALMIDNTDPITHYNLGLLYRRIGNFDGYEKEIAISNRLNPDFAPANIDMAEILLKHGKRDEALKHIEKARRINPHDGRLKKLIENIGGLY